MVIWITGLSATGKTTLARVVARTLRDRGLSAILLDGDAVRGVVADPHVGHDRESRLANAMRICRLTRLIADQDVPVVVSTMSLFREVHAWNRTHLRGYVEVYLTAPLAVLAQREIKGLYARALRGEMTNVVGVDLPYDAPPSPHLVIENAAHRTDFQDLADQILDLAFSVTSQEGIPYEHAHQAG